MTLSFRKSAPVKSILIPLIAVAGLALAAPAAQAAGEAKKPRDIAFSFEGPFGTFDQGQLQRGYKVYREVCAACHSMNLLSFRNLAEDGGPFWDPHVDNPNENRFVRALAAEFEIADIDSETGEPIRRPGTPADAFPDPYPNATAAAAGNGGAVPPDLSVMAKARKGGADYIYSLLSGYQPAPAGLRIASGQHYNPYMPGDLTPFWEGDHDKVPYGGFIAMAQPLRDGQVTYDDDAPETIDQYSRDVAAFIAWASDPKAVERKRTGIAVLAYLAIFAGLTYASYRQIWRNVKH
ncbi:MAG TPA: cytochrome c1 [Brevundimonas sp.]|jgi:ubiquinol-cytochrome c reductase cytochrome c1 subunit|uniref:cytochrome c1 n=1 Tax=Brevundimonas sp. TaxID=1871086 RepID=UPI002E14995D|nr:cytochrome c1 [Brevundimonas sp.]